MPGWLPWFPSPTPTAVRLLALRRGSRDLSRRDDLVDDPISDRLLAIHVIVAVGIAGDSLFVLSGAFDQNTIALSKRPPLGYLLRTLDDWKRHLWSVKE